AAESAQQIRLPVPQELSLEYVDEDWGKALEAPPETPKDFPEFYFTRLVYTENGWRGRRTMPKPAEQFRCPEFGGGPFFPRQGWGWAIDYPGADCKFMGGVHRLTGVRVHPNPHVISLLDPELPKYPYLYAVEVGGMHLSEEEAARLREHLLRGGFLHVDDFWGGRQKMNFEAQMRKVFPDRQLVVIPLTHEIFHTFYDIDEVLQVPNRGNACYGGRTWEQPDDTEPVLYGIFDDRGRLMVMATYNADLGDAWEYMDLPCYPEKYSGYAYRIGINFMVYSMTH
ncbi:MAG TPA: DUF4159 domain-containing protein, partial [Terriglobia bacterium]|nr:DUF4159 domain-containing protein [Terriglobia bacterium]